MAFWQARARVDANGQAQFTVPLNDSLTGFRVFAVAASRNRFGEGHTRVETFKDISVTSGLPLVVRHGDQMDPIFTVRNASAKAQTLQFRAAVSNTTIQFEKTISLAAGESLPVAVPITVPPALTQLDWQVSVTGPEQSDSLQVSQRVLDPIPERVLQATVFQLQGTHSVPVRKPQGSLPGGAVQVSAQASLAESLGAVQEWFRDYPYTCMEQTSAIAVGLQDKKRWQALMEKLPAYQDSNGLIAFYPNTRGYPFLTANLLRLSALTGWEIPTAARQAMIKALSDYLDGKLTFDDWQIAAQDDAHRRLEAMAALALHKQFKASWLSTVAQEESRWTSAMLVNALDILTTAKGIPLQVQRRQRIENILQSRLTHQGSFAVLSDGRYNRWWLYENNEVTQARLILATLHLPAWQDQQLKMMRGLLSLQQKGRWSTTQANLWGAEALRQFSQKFEKESVTGETRLVLGEVSKALSWQAESPAPQRLDWPATPSTLQLTQHGQGKPWVTVQSRARLPLKQAENAGFKITKTLVPLQQKVAGKWSVGDVLQVRLTLTAQNDIGWVVVDDPIPAGSTLLGRALAKDRSLAAEDNRAATWTWVSYAEFAADAWRGYYETIRQGEWQAVYTIRLNQSGQFQLPPTKVEAMYAPEMHGLLPNQPWVVAP